MHILSLLEGLRKEILARLEALPERDRRVVMGRNTELYQALVAVETLLLQARLLSHARSRSVVEQCWRPVKKLGLELGYFEKLRGNAEARRELRSFLLDFPAERPLQPSPGQKHSQKSRERRRKPGQPTFQEEVANVLLPKELEQLRDPHLEETLKALHPKTPENCTPADWERARNRLR